MLAETPIDKACWFGLKFAVGLFRASMSFGQPQSSFLKPAPLTPLRKMSNSFWLGLKFL
jgi:hypothetical protein